MARERGVIYSLSDVEKDYGKGFVQLYTAFKTACIAKEIPMFVAFSNCSKENPLYFTDCVYAILSMPEYGSRIGDLILATRGVDTKYPEYIQRAISVLQDWLNQEKVYTGPGKENPMMRQYEDIAGGRMVPSLFTDDDYEVVEGVRKADEKVKKKAVKKTTEKEIEKDVKAEGSVVAPKKRSRPRKNPEAKAEETAPAPKKRGRPRKNPEA